MHVLFVHPNFPAQFGHVAISGTLAVLLPGSFNPVHQGHMTLASVAEDLRQQPLAYEISVTNVDKPPLAGDTIRARGVQPLSRTAACEATSSTTCGLNILTGLRDCLLDVVSRASAGICTGEKRL